MDEAKFSLIFEGPAVENGEIDIRDLAPSLLALGELIQTANFEINGDKAQIAVKLQATGKGSVEVHLSLVQSLCAQAASLLDSLATHKDGIAAAKDLSDILFKLGAGVVGGGGGFFALIKWLKGRKPDKIEPKGGDVYVHIGDTHFVTNNQVIALAENLQVREQARKLVSVLEKEGIDRISTRRPSEGKMTIDKTEIPSFNVPDVVEEVLGDAEREMFLQIDSLSFMEGNKWRMTDGGEHFAVAIEDIDFTNKVAKSEISFAKGDLLHCLVREKQMRTAKGLLKKERTIIRVIEHKTGARQLKLV